MDKEKGKKILDNLVANSPNTYVLCRYASLLQDGTSPYEKIKKKHGNSEAMTNLGYCYSEGNGVRKDDEKTVEWKYQRRY